MTTLLDSGMRPLDPSVKPVHQELFTAGLLDVVAGSGPEERAWLDCDLASLAENRLGQVLDPRDLNDTSRAELAERACEDAEMPLRSRRAYERCYWLLEDGERVGTMALGNRRTGASFLALSSLYVLPPYRGRGVGRRAMAALTSALRRHDLGLRLETDWCWQRTVRFYVNLAMLAYHLHRYPEEGFRLTDADVRRVLREMAGLDEPRQGSLPGVE